MNNTDEFEWADVHVTLQGEDLEGLKGVSYASKQEKEASYGRGNKPRSIQKGNKSYEGELKVTKEQARTILSTSGKKEMTDIDYFDIPVSYIREEGGRMENDVIKNAQFTENPREMSQGDKEMEIALPFICLDIEYDV